MIIAKREEIRVSLDVQLPEIEESYESFLKRLQETYEVIPEENRHSAVVEVGTSNGYEDASAEITMHFTRLETVEEMLQRVASTALRVNARQRAVEQQERELLKQLLAKYGNDGEGSDDKAT